MRSFLIKVLLVLPLLLLIDYIIMALLGCTTCLFGLGDDFYCGPFCLIGKNVLIYSNLLFGYLIYQDIMRLIKNNKHVTTPKIEKNK